MRLTINYNGKPDVNIDSRLAAVLEHDLGFEWIGQGYDLKKKVRDISFQRVRGKVAKMSKNGQKCSKTRDMTYFKKMQRLVKNKDWCKCTGLMWQSCNQITEDGELLGPKMCNHCDKPIKD